MILGAVYPPLGGPEVEDAAQSIVHNGSYNATFDRFKNLNIPISTIHRRLRDNAHMTQPPPILVDASIEICLAFHIKGLYNICCGRSVDCVPHNEQQDVLLLACCTEF